MVSAARPGIHLQARSECSGWPRAAAAARGRALPVAGEFQGACASLSAGPNAHTTVTGA